jgi:hypothetical protein
LKGPSAAIHGNQTKCLITAENFGEPVHLKADKPPCVHWSFPFTLMLDLALPSPFADYPAAATTLIRPR